MKTSIRVVVVCAMVFALTGCATQKSWVYRANSYSAPLVKTEKTAVVLPFADSRTGENKNMMVMGYIPIVPFGWFDFACPETQMMHSFSGMWVNHKPTDDYAKALAEELESAKIFNETVFDTRKGDSDYVIQGKVLSNRYKAKVFTYGLSVYGPMLWFIGLPAGTVKNELSVQIDCVERASGKNVFSKSYDAQPYKKVGFLYVMPNEFNYPNMLQDLYKQVAADLSKALPGTK